MGAAATAEESATVIEGLERFGIFQDLPPAELQAIAKLCQIAKVKKGEQVFQAGDEATSLFLVRAGKIELRFKVSYYNAAVEIPLESKTEGESFGWSAVTHPYRYTLAAYAVEDSELLQIKRTEIGSLCEANRQLGYLFMKNITRIIGQRFHLLQEALAKEIQEGLKRKDPLA